MNEKFYYVYKKEIKSKKGETFYQVTLCSEYGYLITCFIDELSYRSLQIPAKQVEEGKLSKRYNASTGKFDYFYK